MALNPASVMVVPVSLLLSSPRTFSVSSDLTWHNPRDASAPSRMALGCSVCCQRRPQRCRQLRPRVQPSRIPSLGQSLRQPLFSLPETRLGASVSSPSAV